MLLTKVLLSFLHPYCGILNGRMLFYSFLLSLCAISFVDSNTGDPELASGMAALTISDERRPGANSRSHETALEIR